MKLRISFDAIANGVEQNRLKMEVAVSNTDTAESIIKSVTSHLTRFVEFKIDGEDEGYALSSETMREMIKNFNHVLGLGDLIRSSRNGKVYRIVGTVKNICAQDELVGSTKGDIQVQDDHGVRFSVPYFSLNQWAFVAENEAAVKHSVKVKPYAMHVIFQGSVYGIYGSRSGWSPVIDGNFKDKQVTEDWLFDRLNHLFSSSSVLEVKKRGFIRVIRYLDGNWNNIEDLIVGGTLPKTIEELEDITIRK